MKDIKYMSSEILSEDDFANNKMILLNDLKRVVPMILSQPHNKSKNVQFIRSWVEKIRIKIVTSKTNQDLLEIINEEDENFRKYCNNI